MNLDVVWDNRAGRGDWRVSGGRMATGNLLATAVVISLFTDRVAQPDWRAPDGSADRHGWWMDSFDGIPIGSRLWQLRRRKIANRAKLAGEARDMCREALAWMTASGLVAGVDVAVSLPPAGVGVGAASGDGREGTLLCFEVALRQPSLALPSVRLLWSAV